MKCGKENPPYTDLDEALAVLISSTLRKQRPYSLLKVADALDFAVKRLGGLRAVADRIGVSAKMLGQFRRAQNLTPGAKAYFEDRRLDSIDAAVHLATLPEIAQEKWAEQLHAGKLTTKDLRAALELAHRSHDYTPGKTFTAVAASRTRREFEIEFVIRGGRTPSQIKAAINRVIPSSEIIELQTAGALGRLVVTPVGLRALRTAAKEMDVPFKQIMSRILVHPHG